MVQTMAIILQFCLKVSKSKTLELSPAHFEAILQNAYVFHFNVI